MCVCEAHCANLARSPSTGCLLSSCVHVSMCPQVSADTSSLLLSACTKLLPASSSSSSTYSSPAAGKSLSRETSIRPWTVQSTRVSNRSSTVRASPPSSPLPAPRVSSALCQHPPRPFDKGPTPQLAKSVLGEGPTGGCRRRRTSSWPASDTRSSRPPPRPCFNCTFSQAAIHKMRLSN
jgi:hypothetical protein